MDIRRVLAICVAASLASSVAPLLAQRNNDNNRQEQRVDPDAQALAEFIDLTMVNDPLVTGSAPGTLTLSAPGTPAMRQPPPNEIGVTWQANHFIKGQSGLTYVPYTLNIDRANLPGKSAVLYVRVINETQAKAFSAYLAQVQKATNDKERQKLMPPAYSWTSATAMDLPDGVPVQRAMALPPGKYVAFLAIKERSAAAPQGKPQGNKPTAAVPPAPAGKMGLLRYEIDIPNMSGPDLTTSSVILATTVEPQQAALSQAQQEANPYVFGPMRIVPTLDGRFSKTGNLNVIFWIYGAGDAGSGKPDVTLEYNFHQRLAGGEKYFNKTQPQIVNASTLPPDFNVAAGHQVPGSLEIPLASFPSGDYRLEIKVTDKVSGKTLTQNANFTVLPV